MNNNNHKVKYNSKIIKVRSNYSINKENNININN